MLETRRSHASRHDQTQLDFSLLRGQESKEAAASVQLLRWLRRRWIPITAASILLAIGAGVMAQKQWFPRADGLTGERFGWFGKRLPKNAASAWNPFAPQPLPSPAFLKTEHIYAGASRLLAAEDANASAIPPADLAVWRPSTGMWCVLGGSGQTLYQFGQNGDKPVIGDFDGDGKTDFAVLRPAILPFTSTWWIVRSSDNSSYTVPFGLSTDTLVPADYDGDGKTDIAVWRPSSLTWYIQLSSTNTTVYTQFGSSGDVPAPADYDGDGRADLTVWRQSTHSFYSLNSSNGATVTVGFGTQTGSPVCGDYDGDGKANYAIWFEGDWIIMNAALTQTTTTPWGIDTDRRVQNDYDGDGKVDLAVWRPGFKSATWLIRQSHDLSTRTEYWGVNGDIPVPAYYRR